MIREKKIIFGQEITRKIFLHQNTQRYIFSLSEPKLKQYKNFQKKNKLSTKFCYQFWFLQSEKTQLGLPKSLGVLKKKLDYVHNNLP